MILLTLAATGSGCQSPDCEPIFAEVYVDPPLVKRLAGSPPDLETDVESHAAFISGRRFLTVALQRPEIARLAAHKTADPQGWLAGRIHVETAPLNHLRIIYAGEPSSAGAELVNGLASAYIDEMRDMTARLRAERIVEVESALRDVASRLREKRRALERIPHLLESAQSAGSAGNGREGPEKAREWAVELETLKQAVVQGEEIESRLSSELAELQRQPARSGVGLVRMAELH
jgi:hypothetical protein